MRGIFLFVIFQVGGDMKIQNVKVLKTARDTLSLEWTIFFPCSICSHSRSYHKGLSILTKKNHLSSKFVMCHAHFQ